MNVYLPKLLLFDRMINHGMIQKFVVSLNIGTDKEVLHENEIHKFNGLNINKTSK